MAKKFVGTFLGTPLFEDTKADIAETRKLVDIDGNPVRVPWRRRWRRQKP